MSNEAKEDIHYGTKAIDKINANIAADRRFYSFEFYPPRTDKGVENLKKSVSKMVTWNPQWMDVTWGAGGTTSDLTPEICNYIQNTVGGNCMMHLTCTNMLPEKVDIALKQAKEYGFKNILALRGDPPKGEEEWKAIEGGFECALDLIKYIKKTYGDYFGITVSGYPEGHPVVRKKIAENEDLSKYHAVRELEDGTFEGVNAKDWIGELDYLKAKIDAGGQVIITQLFYDSQIFIDWVKAARKHGITAPILPGIMPIRNYGSFGRMTGFCKTVIPKDLENGLAKLKDTQSELYDFGLDYLHKMCEKILAEKDENGCDLVPGLHFYTMNTEKCTIEIVSKLKIGLSENSELETHINNELKRVLSEDRAKQEELRKKKAEKVEVITKPSPVIEGKFKEIKSF